MNRLMAPQEKFVKSFTNLASLMLRIRRNGSPPNPAAAYDFCRSLFRIIEIRFDS